ncbi:MAG TPA: hypothetical protein VMT18_10440 [Planctomycetota bacterium]|nr:hypothetical protein [Planctomycetota bacterium]
MTSPLPKDAKHPGVLRRWRGPLLALGLLIALLGSLELALRIAVRVPAAQNWPMLGALGEPGNFGDSGSDEAYWEVRHWRTPGRNERGHPKHDTLLGWRSGRFAAQSLEHLGEAALAGRRPLLLFGDSFAEGIWPDTVEDFSLFFPRTDLARDFALLNYGVGGYGLDQIALLAERVVERHAARNPVALVSLLVDDDIDRCVLDFRVWPKPRLRLEEGRWTGAERAVPTMAEYLEQRSTLEPLHLSAFLSALWSRVDTSRRAALEREKQELARALLARAVADLRAHGVDFLFVLFRQGQSIVDPGTCGWRATLCTEVLDSLGAPWVDVGPAFRAHAALTGRVVWDYFLPREHPAVGHHNALGDRIAFEVMREGLAQHLGLGEGGTLVLVEDVRAPDGAALPQWREADHDLEGLGLQPPFLWAVLDGAGRAELRWTPRGDAAALRGRATALRGELRLECERDRVRTALGERFEIDLAGVDELVLEAAGTAGARVVWSELELETARRVPPPLGRDGR